MADETITSDIKGYGQDSFTGIEADKIFYGFKRIMSWPVAAKIQLLGMQGATSATNTRTSQATQLKNGTLKGAGAPNQQRTVDCIYPKETNGFDLHAEIRQIWDNNERFGLWRIDFGSMHGKKPNRKVRAQYSHAILPALPYTEALGGFLTSNLAIEVEGMERDFNDDGNWFELPESSFEPGTFDKMNKFYNYSLGTDQGTDEDGNFVDNTVDDETLFVNKKGTTEDVPGPSTPTGATDSTLVKTPAPDVPSDEASVPTNDGAKVESK